jgi:hypothetical protein
METVVQAKTLTTSSAGGAYILGFLQQIQQNKSTARGDACKKELQLLVLPQFEGKP